MDETEPALAYDHALSEMRKDAPDLQKALHLLEQAHQDGDARATYALATWYHHGRPPVVDQDLAQAYSLLQSAAAAAVPDALFDMGVAYEKGELGEVNEWLAFASYLKAALLGESQSVYEVARCYKYGIGVAVDHRVSGIWLDRAEQLGVSDER